MRVRRWSPSFWVIFFMDVLMSLMIIIIVLGAIASTSNFNTKAVTSTTAVAEGVGMWRHYIMAYHAIHGEWPQSMDDLKPFMPEPEPELAELYEDMRANEDIRLTGGAFDLIMTGKLKGEVLTVHPAVPFGDEMGPVRWVAGSGTPDGWTVIGEDHTTIEEKYIPIILRR